jgi:LuxR family transcriptional regulator, maltose regulon positive regulatory protein
VPASAPGDRGASPGARFALAKFRPTMLPTTLVTRSVLHERLAAGAGKRLTVVVGSAGAGKSVLLSSWAAARPPGLTSWLSCDRADADPARFWTGFIEAPRAIAPGFGADAADLLAMDGVMSADVSASIANDAAKLPAGSVVIVDDFHYAAAAVSGDMTDLVECWPDGTAQLVLATRADPPLRLHRLRISGELGELRDRDLYFSLRECHDLLANFGVQVAAGDLALLHQRSEGWAAALQMVALSLRATTDPVRAVRALDLRSQAIADYFIAEVLDQQPPEVAEFMLDTSVLAELTADACAAVTGRQDAAALLHSIGAADLFLVPLDDKHTTFRYHHLVRQVLRAELRARDRAREQKLQLRAAEWMESAGDTRRAARHFLAAQQPDQALALLQDRVVPDFLHDPVTPAPLDLSMIGTALLADAPDRLVGLAFDLLLSGDLAHGSQFLAMLERAQPPPAPESQLAARTAVLRSFHHAQIGQLDEAVGQALAARAIQRQMTLGDDWEAAVPLILLRVYPCLEDLQAVEDEAAAALALPGLPDPARLILVPSARAVAWFEAGRLTDAANAAAAAQQQAGRLGFGQHFFAVDYLRVLSGLALERRDLDLAERLTEQALSITERRRPLFEFLALLDRAAIWAARGQVREALASVEAARLVLAGTGSPVLLARADELEAPLRLALGDPHAAAELASGLPAARRGQLLARIALATGKHGAAREHLRALPSAGLTSRRALVHQILQAAAAIGLDDPTAAGLLGGARDTARRESFLNTVVTTAPQVTSYLIEHAPQMRPDPFMAQLIAAALAVRATQLDGSQPRHQVTEPLTAAEMRILRLLPTSTYLQIAATPAPGLSERLAETGQFPPLMARKFGGRLSAGLLFQAIACLILAVLFKLDAIASIGSAVALLIFAFITAAHFRVRSETGAKAWILALAIAAAAVVLITFIFTTLIHEPASILTLAGVLVLSIALDYGWKRSRDRRADPGPGRPLNPRELK